MNDDTTPTLTDEAPPEVAPLHPDLLPTLQELDQDISGEQKFCRQASDSLQAFQVRWGSDVAVSDGYRSAIVALDNMASILEGAHTRLTQEATRTVMEKVSTAQHLQTAQAAREYAIAWAETPPPPAEPPPDPPADPVLAYSPGV